MKKSTRLIIFALCICMLLPILASCADSDGGRTDIGNVDQDFYDNSTREKTKGNLPDDIDLDAATVGLYYAFDRELQVKGEDEETD
ncbi:MAG: hypothetical protein IKB34_02225, partial [Clostridia bacterium]|nr:hypothetical protein [Clostridia bacterium]